MHYVNSVWSSLQDKKGLLDNRRPRSSCTKPPKACGVGDIPSRFAFEGASAPLGAP